MSGSRVVFLGEQMSGVVHALIDITQLLGQPPVVVGGLAVLSRLSSPYRATTDVDVLDRRLSGSAHLDVLRQIDGAAAVEPAAVLLPTPYGPVKVDVLEIRQAELDRPSDDPGDRLHAFAHAWANDTATNLTIEAVRSDGSSLTVTTPVAEPGPLIAMKLQAVMNRSVDKQGTDLLDIVRLTFDQATRPAALAQISAVHPDIARDITLHVDLWFRRRRQQARQWITQAGGTDVTPDDLDLVTELLENAAHRT